MLSPSCGVGLRASPVQVRGGVLTGWWGCFGVPGRALAPSPSPEGRRCWCGCFWWCCFPRGGARHPLPPLWWSSRDAGDAVPCQARGSAQLSWGIEGQRVPGAGGIWPQLLSLRGEHKPTETSGIPRSAPDPSSRSGPGAQRWGLRSRAPRRLPAHLGSAGGWRGTALLPTPFPSSKSKSLFLRISGCRPAVRQPDGKGTGALLPSLLAPCRRPLQIARSPAGAVPGTWGGRSSVLQLGCSTRGSAQLPSRNLRLRWAQGRIAKCPEPAVPGWLCPAPL